MSRKPQSKDEALEALDFIVNVLKEHEKDLDRLINELGTVTEAIGATGELTSKVEKVEERITGLQNEITNLVSFLSTSPREPAPAAPAAPATAAAALPKEEPKTEPAPAIQVPIQAEQPIPIQGPPVILRCKQWEDFQGLATQAQTLSYMIKEPERTFQADALKGNQIITYTGEIPRLAPLMKIWLSKKLEIPELVSFLSTSPRETPAPATQVLIKDATKTETTPALPAPGQAEQTITIHGPPVILRCKQWEDFQGFATQAQTLSFMFKEPERTFQADALKGDQIITYTGEIPKLAPLMKIWLSKQLDIPERKVLEGVLAIA